MGAHLGPRPGGNSTFTGTNRIVTGVLTDYTPITNTNASAFTYFAMPSGPRTMLNYITSFGVNQSSANTTTGSWPGGFDPNLRPLPIVIFAMFFRALGPCFTNILATLIPFFKNLNSQC